MKLFWQPRLLPRTLTHKQWRDIDRWRRVTQKQLSQEEKLIFANIQRLMIFGQTDLAQRLADRLTNPPLLVHPLMIPRKVGQPNEHAKNDTL